MRILSILLLLQSCSSLVGVQVAKLAYDTKGYKDEIQAEHEERITCLKEKRCVSYWDNTTGIWVVHAYTLEELEDIKVTESLDGSKCLEEKKCEIYFNKYKGRKLIHRLTQF